MQPSPSADPPRRIALCIDDVGLHDGIDAAAMRLVELGRVTTLSCMVGARRWRGTAGALRTLDASRVEIGLHVDFTEQPLRPASRRSLRGLIVAAYSGRLDRAALRAEVDAQLDAFEDAMGRAPDHVDGHQHVHQLPLIRDVVLDALQARSSAQRPWLRHARAPRGAGPIAGNTLQARIKPWLIGALGAQALAEQATVRGFRMSGRLLGIYDFDADRERYLERLRAWFAMAHDGDVLMCHASGPSTAADAIKPAREAEYAVLAGDGFGALSASASVRFEPLSAVQSRKSSYSRSA